MDEAAASKHVGVNCFIAVACRLVGAAGAGVAAVGAKTMGPAVVEGGLLGVGGGSVGSVAWSTGKAVGARNGGGLVGFSSLESFRGRKGGQEGNSIRLETWGSLGIVASLATGGVPEALRVGCPEVGVGIGEGLVGGWLLFPVMEALLHDARELHDTDEAAKGSGIGDRISSFIGEFLAVLVELNNCLQGLGDVPRKGQLGFIPVKILREDSSIGGTKVGENLHGAYHGVSIDMVVQDRGKF